MRKYAFCGNFQTLQKKRAAAPEPTLQTKMKKIQIKIQSVYIYAKTAKRDKQREVDEWH